VAEPTRLRILVILVDNELTVSELTRILGQSQPRVSRHLKVLCNAGLLERFREGAWVFYRLAEDGPGAEAARSLLPLIPEDDEAVAGDARRVGQVREEREQAAARYFREMAPHWHEVRSLYVPETAVENAMLEAAGGGRAEHMVDIGTGTGRILEVFAPRVRRGTGFDLSHAMLSVARAGLAKAGIRNCQARHGDLYKLPLPARSADLVTIHQVLHYLEYPGAGVAEAARILRPGGCLLIVDFAPHDLEFLRTEHAHRRLGLADESVARWCREAGLNVNPAHQLAGDREAGQSLTVSLWQADKQAESRLKEAS